MVSGVGYDRAAELPAASRRFHEIRRVVSNLGVFDFGGPEPRKTSTPFAKERCWSCHNEHGQTDNVFTQFYPGLRKTE